MKQLILFCFVAIGFSLWGQTSEKVNPEFVYELPFKSGKTRLVTQGYMGKYSHEGEHALDFRMRKGESIYASRGGVVTNLFEDSYRTLLDKSNAYHANFLVIEHDDGSYSKYMHMDYKGILVEKGDTISTGQLIAVTGNTGNSTMAHLHFVCYNIDENGEAMTFPTVFSTKKGLAALKPWHFYRKPKSRE